MSEPAPTPEPQPQPTDAWLLAAARSDPEAFCEVYERHYAPIRSWFLARVRNDSVALDLTAETFAQALRGLHRFRDEADGSAAPWLYGIARHLWLKYERRARVETAAREKLGMPLRDYTVDDLDRVDEWIDVEADAGAMRRAFGSLRPEEREVLELRVVQGLSYAEVARELSSSEPASAQARDASAAGTSEPPGRSPAMTNLDATGYRLREDLHAAAQAQIARRQQTARRRKRLAIGFATAALLAGGGATAAALLSRTTAPAPTATISTASSPSPPPTSVSPPANARAQMSVFASAPPSAQQTPKPVTHALDTYAHNPGQNLGAITAPPRLLASIAHAAVYAAPTDRGYVCFAVWDGDSAAGSCAQDLTPEGPISAITGQASRGTATLVAGVASDSVVSITAVGSSGPICQAQVTNNGFVCEASGTGAAVTSFLVHLRDGTVVTVPF